MLLAAVGRHPLMVGGLSVLVLLLTLLYASTARAAPHTATNTNDSGPGSLRAAMSRADSAAGADEIRFAPGVSGTITLGSRLPTVTDPAGLSINGGGDVTVSGNDEVGILLVSNGAKLDLSNLTVADGVGAAILNFGTLTVTGSTLSRNSSTGQGGGISGYGDLTVTSSTFSHNSALNGGGIGSDGMLRVANSTFSNNSAGTCGGAIYNGLDDEGALDTVTNTTFSANGGPRGPQGGAICHGYGTLRVTNSTFFNNNADQGGGIVTGWPAVLTVTSSTFSRNSARDAGGGIANYGDLTVTNGTISANSAPVGGGIHTYSTARLRNTILAGSVGGSNCSAHPSLRFVDGGFNVDSGTSCGFTRANRSLPSTNPLLDPAGTEDNGGPTETIALRPGSPAVGLVAKAACPPPATDQRGVKRPQGAACDSGAFELRRPRAR